MSDNVKKGNGGRIALAIAIALLAGAVLMASFMPAFILLFGNALVSDKTEESAQLMPGEKPDNESEKTETPVIPDVELGGSSPVISGEAENTVVEIVRQVRDAVVLVGEVSKSFDEDVGMVAQESDLGSGVVISADGYIVTNEHVVADREQIKVTFMDGESVMADVVGEDSRTDIALLKIDPADYEGTLTVAAIGDSDALEVGQQVVAIGNPLGGQLAGTVTVGYISGLNREVVIDGVKFNLIQTDASINLGNSGGALLNSKGELIGINNAKSYMAGYDSAGNAVSVDGIGFSIPVNQAMDIVRSLIENGTVSRPGLGIMGVVIAEGAYEGVPAGIMVQEFAGEDSAAYLAGIEIYDVITHIDGLRVTEFNALWQVLDAHEFGDTVTITVWRFTDDNNSQTLEIPVVLQKLDS